MNANAAKHAAVSTPGRIVFEGPVNSPLLGGERTVHIYLPGSYDSQPAKHYPVLYIHDGQNAFSTAGPGAAFGWGPWDLDNTVSRMAMAGEIREIILVAVDCSKSRYREYLGPTNTTSSGRSAYSLYSRFLIEELKPRIDHDYRTLKDAKHTGIMGSSMGGICSVALAWEHPKVFGLAAAFSSSFQVEQQAFLKHFLKATPKRKPDFKLYLDSGRIDYSGGDDGMALSEQAAAELHRLGWKEGKNISWHAETPPTVEQLAPYHLSPGKHAEALTSQHNELSWRMRSPQALRFLFPPVP